MPMKECTHETKVKLKELNSTTNKHLKKSIFEIESVELTEFILSVLKIEKISNKELTKIFEILVDYYVNTEIDIRTALAIVDYRFLRGSKDIEIAIFSYFRLLSIIRRKTSENDELKSEIYNKCIIVIENKITHNFILKEVYFLLRSIMLDDVAYLNYFISEKYYKNFAFFNNFINDFYKHLDDEKSVELYEFVTETYQAELFLRFRDFNPYLPLLKRVSTINFKVPLLYLTYDLNILYENAANSTIMANYSDYLCEINDFITISNNIAENLKDNNDCYFRHLHFMIEEKIRYKEEILGYLDNFNDKSVFQKLENIFHNPFYFLRFSKRTNFTKLGNFISKENNTKYLKQFMETFDFSEMSIVPAVREFFTSFILPKESQMIIRLLEEFSDKYYQDLKKNSIYSPISNKEDKNKQIIDSIENEVDNMLKTENNKAISNIEDIEINKKSTIEPDITKYSEKDIYMLVYSMIILNTDLYNVSIKSKMNRKVYIDNIRKCNLSEAFSDSFLETIYYNIKSKELEYISSNQINLNNYKIMRKLENNVKEEKIREFFTDNKFNKPLPIIENEICYNCKNNIYNKTFEVHCDEILKIVFNESNDVNNNSNNILDMFVKATKFFNLSNVNIDLCFLFYKNFDESYFDLFFDLFHEILELKNGDELCIIEKEIVSEEKVYFFELPFLIINKKLTIDKEEKSFLFKKDKKIDYDHKKTTDKFIRTMSSMSNTNFEWIVKQNLKTSSGYSKEVLFQIIYKNCFRIHLIMDTDLIVFLAHRKTYIKEIFDKIIDLDLKEEFYKFLMLYDSYNLGCDDIVFKITKEHVTFLDDRIFLIYKNSCRTESEKAFMILLHVNRYTPIFDAVCGNFVNNYVSLTNSIENVDLEEIQERNPELFVKHLMIPSKLISFYMSSSECINYVVMARFTCKKNNSTEKMGCPLENQQFIDKINKQVTYIILKNHILDNYDLNQYTFYTIQILSRAIPSFIEYLLNNIFIFRYINGFTLKTIIKIIFTSIKRYRSTKNVCVCEQEHNIDDRIKRLLDFLTTNNYLSAKQLAYINELKSEIQNEAGKINSNKDNSKDSSDNNVFEL